VKFWWFADYIQYDNQRKLQKKHPRFFSERLHAPANSFISKNEGMNEGAGSRPAGDLRCAPRRVKVHDFEDKKLELQKLADETGLTIKVRHYPPVHRGERAAPRGIRRS
jgi:hypothetical protein